MVQGLPWVSQLWWNVMGSPGKELGTLSSRGQKRSSLLIMYSFSRYLGQGLQGGPPVELFCNFPFSPSMEQPSSYILLLIIEEENIHVYQSLVENIGI